MIKLRDILLEKKLRVFDFDDTLVKSNSKVFVINKGKRKTLTPGEFAFTNKNLVMSLISLNLIKSLNLNR